MTWSPMRPTRLAFIMTLALTAGSGVSGSAGGQELPWLGRGRVRLDVAPSFWAWDSRFGTRTDASGLVVDEVEPLGMDLTANPLGSGVFPYLTNLEESLRDALQDPDYRVRLGASQAIMEHSRLVLPFRLELGLTDWLTVGAMVPLVRPRTELSFALNADSLSADVGLVPGTGTFLSTFDAALVDAEASNPGDPSLIQARAYLDALSAAYGHGSVFPVEGSEGGARLQARLDEIRSALAAAGVTGIPEIVPLAQTYLTEEDITSLLTSPAMLAYPLEDWTTPWALGDVEITAAVRVLRRGFDPDSLGELPFLRFQAGIGGLVRLGTGAQGDQARLLDPGVADGQMDIEGSVFGLVELGSRFGGWGHLRYGLQRKGEILRRIASPSEILPPRSRLALLGWTPGNYFDFQVNPRFYFTPEMTFGVRYHYWSKGEDQYDLSPMDPETLALTDFPPPEYLNYETGETLQELGISATFSTLAANARGESPLPLQVRFTYLRPLSGQGGRTPKGGRFEAGVSLYRTLWGRGNGPEPPPDPGSR